MSPAIPLPLTLPVPDLALALTAPVGDRGKNRPPDVLRVQDALNAIPASEGTPATLLHPDGIAGPKTCGAIQNFQLQHFGWKGADGRIDPGGRTAQLISGLLVIYGNTRWTVRRVEAAQPAPGNVLGRRTVSSPDRLFEFADQFGICRAVYFFRPVSEANALAAEDLPALDGRPELNPFQTATLCSPYAFVGEGTYSEYSPAEDQTLIQLAIQPRMAHIAGGVLRLHVRHQWIHEISSPGDSIAFPGTLSFVRDDSYGQRKRPRH